MVPIAIPQISQHPISAKTRKVVETETIAYKVPIKVLVTYEAKICMPEFEVSIADPYELEKHIDSSECFIEPQKVSQATYTFSYPIIIHKKQLNRYVNIDDFLLQNIKWAALADDGFRRFYTDQLKVIVNKRLNEMQKINQRFSIKEAKPDEISFAYDPLSVEYIEQKYEPYYLTTFDY